MNKKELIAINKQQYKYYKITRDDGYITYCNALNWLEEYFKIVFGLPSEWVESDEKVNIKSNKYELEIPVRVEAVANGYTFVIELCRQEFYSVPLRYIERV